MLGKYDVFHRVNTGRHDGQGMDRGFEGTSNVSSEKGWCAPASTVLLVDPMEYDDFCAL